jgi:chromate transporter
MKLFTSTFYLSAFTFGGGYIILPLLRKKFVEEYGWINENEMLDLMAIAQSSPGAIAVNASILIGYRLAGLMGALMTIIGTVLPPLIILSIISSFYASLRHNILINIVLKGMQAGIAAIIIDVTVNMSKDIFRQKSIFPAIIMIGSFIAAYVFKVNIIFIILICGILGTLSSAAKINRKADK